MSFILDALKKSESERQEQTGAEFSNVPSRSGNTQSLKWLWILALLLGVNIAVLLGVLMRRDAPPAVPIESPAIEPVEEAEPSFEEQVAKAKELQIEREQQAATEPAPQPRATPQIQSAPRSRPSTDRVKTIDELRLTGSLQMTDLHLDIHVYSDNPDERFVFINMVKLREGSQLDEGPVVNEITHDGVILTYQGMTFLLPRE